MAPRKEIKEQVLAHLIKVIEEANELGLDGASVARKMYPDIPSSVIASAEVATWSRAENAWWESVERTIDGEIIKNAISGPKA